METFNIPIIFIHYGDSDYLEYTFKLARLYNPTNRIILLGDKSNQHYTKLNIEHYFFDSYSSFPEIILFKKVFKFIAGNRHGKTQWTQFVFERWFYIYEFIRLQGIDQFWTFDSDTLILTELQKYIPLLLGYECTEQCNGSCMNGFVGSSKVVKGYIDTINNLFIDSNYLKKQMQEFLDYPNYAFTEMRAYDEYRSRNKLNTIRLQKISNDEIFDECLCQPHGMEFVNGKNKLVFKDGIIYQREQDSYKLIKVNTINMSWNNIYLVEALFTYVVNNHWNRFPRNYLFIHCVTFLKYVILRIISKPNSILKNIYGAINQEL